MTTPPGSLRHGKGYGLLAAALVVFTACIFFSFSRIKEANEAALSTAGVSLWLAFQADYELQRLVNTLDLYVLDQGHRVSRGALLDRFDIFWSRLPLLVQGYDSAAIKRVSDAEALVPRLIAELEAIEPALTSLEPDDRAAYDDLRRRLGGFQEALRQLALDVDQSLGREHTALHRQMEVLYSSHIVYLIGILGSAGVLIFLLIRETLTARRLLAAATAAQARIEHLAHHDPLTDLPNRVLFHDRLERALIQARRHRRKVAVHCLDLDQFKEVNDTFGHLVGDALLVAAARRMQACLRASDTLGRLGGDEFAIVQTDLGDGEGAAALARRLTEAFRRPVSIGGREVAAGTSVGVALFPDDAPDSVGLLRNADMALYRAKADGRNTWRFYAGDLSRSTPGRADAMVA